MGRKQYLEDGLIGLYEYIKPEDEWDRYNCWQDIDTQNGYNHKSDESFEEFCGGVIESRFTATVVRLADGVCVGSIFVSPENVPPDLAIIIYTPYRGKGYGTRAFSLGVSYCFDVLSLDRIYAGCYPHNTASLGMLQKCGFLPHPEGNLNEKHYLTGEDIVQLDFVKCNPNEPLRK